jgi:hypothetical protein
MLSIVVALAAGAVAMFGGSAQANTVTIGSQLTNPGAFVAAPLAAPATRTNYVVPAPGTAVSPVDGTIRSWRFIGSGGPFTPRVLRAVSGINLTGDGTGAPANATAPGVVSGPFTLALPINRGEFFAADAANPSGLHIAPTPGSTFLSFVPPLAENSGGTPPTLAAAGELGLSAVVTYCVVPKLKGKTGKAARQALNAADCELGDVNKSNKRRPVKSVLSQSVKAGKQISDTEPVDFKISKKKK